MIVIEVDNMAQDVKVKNIIKPLKLISGHFKSSIGRNSTGESGSDYRCIADEVGV